MIYETEGRPARTRLYRPGQPLPERTRILVFGDRVCRTTSTLMHSDDDDKLGRHYSLDLTGVGSDSLAAEIVRGLLQADPADIAHEIFSRRAIKHCLAQYEYLADSRTFSAHERMATLRRFDKITKTETKPLPARQRRMPRPCLKRAPDVAPLEQGRFDCLVHAATRFRDGGPKHRRFRISAPKADVARSIAIALASADSAALFEALWHIHGAADRALPYLHDLPKRDRCDILSMLSVVWLLSHRNRFERSGF